MDLLVIGANSLLGPNVGATAQDRGWNVTGTYHTSEPELDIPFTTLRLRRQMILKTVLSDVSPDWVVNCAAMTGVDGCEADPERAQAVNTVAPETIGQVCQDTSARYLHVSADYAFDGEATEKH